MATPRRTPDMIDPRTSLHMYTPQALGDSDLWTEKELRAEYSRLRSIAVKRLKTLSVEAPKSLAYKSNVGKYPTLKGMSTAEVKKLLPDLAKFIRAKRGTATGIQEANRKAAIKLASHGYFIAASNVEDFGDFMESFRAGVFGNSIGSPEAVDLYETMVEEAPSQSWELLHELFLRWQEETTAGYEPPKKKAKGEPLTAQDVLEKYAAKLAEESFYFRYNAQRQKLQQWAEKEAAKGHQVTDEEYATKFIQLESARYRKNLAAAQARREKAVAKSKTIAKKAPAKKKRGGRK